MNDETTPVTAPPVPAATTEHPPRRRRGLRFLATGAVGAMGVAAGVVIGVQTGGTATAAVSPAAATEPVVTFGRGYGQPTPPGQGSSNSTAVAAGTATADQVLGVVDIVSELGYSGGESAGTGMVLTANGEVLTNNHVVEGATRITVTVLSTGEQYTATVVGTAPTADVAVLRLTDASGLETVRTDSDGVAVGEAVTAVGNAGGDPTSTSAAPGTVTALDQSITASSESGTDAERLTGLIETNADVQAGDSGGPLFDADGEVVGMDTAASSGGAVRSYAIPIATALDVAGQIGDGVDSATVHQGLPAFLGVSVADDGTVGATIAGVVSGGPADRAGLTAGDVVTAVGRTTVGTAEDLATALDAQAPGDEVAVTWTDTTGTSHTATVTLVAGPAD